MISQSSNQRLLLLIALSIFACYSNAGVTLLGVGAGTGNIKAHPGSFLPFNASCLFNSTDIDGVGLTQLEGIGMVVALDQYHIQTAGGTLTHSRTEPTIFRRGKLALQFMMLDARDDVNNGDHHQHMWSLQHADDHSSNDSVVDLYRVSTTTTTTTTATTTAATTTTTTGNVYSYELHFHGSMNVTDVLLPALPDVTELNHTLTQLARDTQVAAPTELRKTEGLTISVTSILALLSRVATSQHHTLVHHHDTVAANMTLMDGQLTALTNTTTALSAQLLALDAALVAANATQSTLLDTQLGELKHSWGAQLQSVESGLTAIFGEVNSTVEGLAGRLQAQEEQLPLTLSHATEAVGAVLLGVVEEQGGRLEGLIRQALAECNSSTATVEAAAADAVTALNDSIHLALATLASDTHTLAATLHTALAAVNATAGSQADRLNTSLLHLLAEVQSDHAAAAMVFRGDIEDVEQAVARVNETLSTVNATIALGLDALWANMTSGWEAGVAAVAANLSAKISLENATYHEQLSDAMRSLTDQLAAVNTTARLEVTALATAVNASLAGVLAAVGVVDDEGRSRAVSTLAAIDQLSAETAKNAAEHQAAWRAALGVAEGVAAQALAAARSSLTDEVARVGVSVVEAEAGVRAAVGEVRSAMAEGDAALGKEVGAVRDWVDGRLAEVGEAQGLREEALRAEVVGAVGGVAAAAAANVTLLSELMYGELATVYEGIQVGG